MLLEIGLSYLLLALLLSWDKTYEASLKPGKISSNIRTGPQRDEVQEAFEAYLECGILAHGCTRAHCNNPQCNRC